MICGDYQKGKSRYTYFEKLVLEFMFEFFLPDKHKDVSMFSPLSFDISDDTLKFNYLYGYSNTLYISLDEFIKISKRNYFSKISNFENFDIDVIRYILSGSKEEFLINEFDRFNKIYDVRTISDSDIITVGSIEYDDGVSPRHTYCNVMLKQYKQSMRNLKLDKLNT